MNANIDNDNLDIDILQATSQLSLANRWHHFLKRLGSTVAETGTLLTRQSKSKITNIC